MALSAMAADTMDRYGCARAEPLVFSDGPAEIGIWMAERKIVDAPRIVVRVANASSDQQRGARDEERRTIKERVITGE